MSEDYCPACGAFVEGGRAGCQAVWDKISQRAYNNIDFAATHDLAFDTYCMQHVEQYCLSAKSYAAHLTRLCCGLEYHGERKVYQAIQKWLNGAVAIEKPEILKPRGTMTVVHLQRARNPEEHTLLVHEWAKSVWEAYRSQHGLAHAWIQTALAVPPRKSVPR